MVIGFLLSLRNLKGNSMEWISVEDRLPERGSMVLVYGGIAIYQGDNTWYSITAIDWPGRLISWNVKHWMPIPEPPKED